MLIEGNDGVTVSLRPARWQFPADAGAWDDRWLVIDGTVNLGDKAWSFTDPCLLIEEAHELAIWLRNAAQDRIASSQTAAGEQVEPSLSFMEPLLGFSVTAHRDDELVLHVELAAEAAPPWLHVANPHSDQYTVELRLRSDELLAAATAWSQQLDALPSRTFARTD
ncbi:hypothetical protein AMIS_41390 [Actinoplanes missouriensis 431]|uniref:Uncharacterized protein n=1 Tax=Actinoplanes missouriensis (strain ATCC 14538 / DSM 43046 / CBS 188.64 / JCM 3121 / NBRC 102363 / NCIMB 12654 / NRRL B-3342 / UNCC 431) TaxID=512565 RepID=I0H8M2_ACTM4|nr:hypothetical protein [Actinoplanes missouriensis]BAL89359.1 hypothetical protein AMIS_41390 [Actinoplanes missouriensis 431]